MEELKIRRAEGADAAAAAALEALCFSCPWTEEELLSDIEENTVTDVILAETGGALVGYLDILTILDECDIRRVAVHPAFRRQGIAFFLLEALFREADPAGVHRYTLEVRESNRGALALYRQAGFAENGRRKDYSDREDGGKEDAILMERKTDPENRCGGK